MENKNNNDETNKEDTNSVRPFTAKDFDRKLDAFDDYIDFVTFKSNEHSVEERRVRILETLRFDHFSTRIQLIFGTDIDVANLKKVYKKICLNPDYKVEWSELFGYTSNDPINVKKGSDSESDDDPAGADAGDNEDNDDIQIFIQSYKIRVGDASGDKAKRDIIQCIYYSPEIDCFLTVAQKGAVTVWNSSKLRLQTCTFLKEQTEGWLTGCCLLPNAKRIMVTAERSLTIWDYRNKQSNATGQNNIVTVQSMANLTCIDTIHLPSKIKDTDKVIVGDSFGYIMTMEINVNDLSSNNTKPDLLDPSKRVIDLQEMKRLFVKKKIHDEAVTKIKYIKELSCFISCSVSEKVSLVIEDLRKFETKDVKINRQASINKGLNTFCYCSQANILATGGKDKYIRLYNPLILNKTIGKLPGHLFTIVDLACNEKDQQLISLSAERVFRVWDLSTFKCLQIFSDTENRPGEKRIFCIYFDQKRERLLTCSSALDCWPVASSVNDTTQVPHSHDKPLVSICYSHNQIATISSDSNLKVWDTVTGRLVYSVKECHGRYSTSNPTDRKTIEVTCMTRDVTGYKLITGAINGSIKIWDFGSGSNLKSKQDITSDDNDLKIISINYLKIKDQLLLFACGWGNKIKIFYDSHDSNDLILKKSIELSQIKSAMGQKLDLRKISLVATSFNKSLNKSVDKTSSLRSKLSHMSSRDRTTINESVLSTKSIETIPENKAPEDLVNYSILKTHKIKCSAYYPEKTYLFTGDNSIAIWNISNETFIKEISFPLDYEPTDALKMCLAEVYRIEGNACNHLRTIVFIRIVAKPKKKSQPKPTINLELIEPPKENEKKTSQPSNEPLASKKSLAPNTENNKNKVFKKSVSFASDKDSEESTTYFIITSHEDASVRFWTEEGMLINEIVSPKGNIITALYNDINANYLYTGDSFGYISIFSISELFKKYHPSNPNDLAKNSKLTPLIVCWKAHVNKIVSLSHSASNGLIFSASLDESVRAWWGLKGRFIGFLGQVKNFVIPKDDSSSWSFPYDISEPPSFSSKYSSDRKNLEKNFEYPLIVDQSKLNYQPKPNGDNENEGNAKNENFRLIQSEKYFDALVRPRHQMNGSYSNNYSSINDGSVFSSLPLYKEQKTEMTDFKQVLMTNPYRKTREISYLAFEKRRANLNLNKTKSN